MSFFFSSKPKQPASPGASGATIPPDDDDNDGGIIIVEAPSSQECPPGLLCHSRQEHDDVHSFIKDDMTSLFYDLPQVDSAKTIGSVCGSVSVHHPEDDPLLNTTLSVASLLDQEDWDLSQSDLNSLEDDLLQIDTMHPHDSSVRPSQGKLFLDDVSIHDDVDTGRPALGILPVLQPRHYEFETLQTIALGLQAEQRLEKSLVTFCHDDTESPLQQPLGNDIESQATTKPHANHVWNVLILIFAAALAFVPATSQVKLHTVDVVTIAIVAVITSVILSARMLPTFVVRATITVWLCYKFGTWMVTNNLNGIETLSFVDRTCLKALLIWSILLSNSTLPEAATFLSPSSVVEDVDIVGTVSEKPVVQHESLSIAGPPGLSQDEPFSYQIVARLDSYKTEDVSISYHAVTELSFPNLAPKSLKNQSLILAGLFQDYELGIRDDSILLHSSNITNPAPDTVMLLIGIMVLICIVWFRPKRAPTTATLVSPKSKGFFCSAVATKSEGFFRSLTGEGLRAECRTRGLKAPVLRQDMIRHLCKHDEIDHSFPERNLLNYRHLTKDQLQRSLKELGQMTSGNKADLQYRLLTARERLYKELTQEELNSMVQQNQLKTKGLESARCLAEAGPWIRLTVWDAYFSSLTGSSHQAECRTCKLKSPAYHQDMIRPHSKHEGIEHSLSDSNFVNVPKSQLQRSSTDGHNLSHRKDVSRLPSRYEPVSMTSIQNEQKGTLRPNQPKANGVELTLAVAEAGSLIPPAKSEAYFCSLTGTSLQAECRMRGLKVPVLRQDMIRRLCEHDRVEHSFPKRNLLKYKHLNKNQLQRSLKDLGQMTSGNKEDLQYRLLQARESVYRGLKQEDLQSILRQNHLTPNGMELARCLAEAGPQLQLQVGSSA